MENNTDKKYILEVKNLSKYFPIATNFFGKPTCYLKAVNNVSFSLEKVKQLVLLVNLVVVKLLLEEQY